MFAVLFEVHPGSAQWNAYLGNAKLLRPELEAIDGFVDNVRYRSLTREGWILSLSSWRDEKALVRWRTQARHHAIQEKGRSEIFTDYHLRVGQLTRDTRLPPGSALQEQRLDETQTGEGTTVTLLDAARAPEWVASSGAGGCAEELGLDRHAPGLVGWDVFDAILTPGHVLVMAGWRSAARAEAFESGTRLGEGTRLRRIRVVRAYGMFDRREAPQYYPEVKPRG